MLFELPSLQHIDAQTVEEALFWLKKLGERAKLIAGGTDLLGLMKDRIAGPGLAIPEVLVNIKTIPDLNRITHDEKSGLRIGCGVTLHRLETAEVIKHKFHILSQAAGQVGTTQIRSTGTIGGNLCQRPRCLYFRHPFFICRKKGGSRCLAITGEHRDSHAILEMGGCVMAHPSDIAPPLLALKGKVLITSLQGEREVPGEDFFLGGDRLTETVLKSDELLTEIRIPNPGEGTYQGFLKHRIRNTADFSLISVATVARISRRICEDLRIVIGGVAPFPYLARRAGEIVRGRRLEGERISRAAEESVREARPLAQNGFKKDLTEALVKRSLNDLWRDSRGE